MVPSALTDAPPALDAAYKGTNPARDSLMTLVSVLTMSLAAPREDYTEDRQGPASV